MTESATMRRGRVDVLMLVALAGIAAAYVRALLFTPPDMTQGIIQKILYVHASAAWASELAFVLVAIAGCGYLWLKDERLDRFAASSVEVGLLFIVVTITTGPIWAKPVWGGYWNWGDARLTSYAVLGLTYLSYLVLRGAIEDRQLRARFSAILGIMGALLVPFVHWSVLMFNSAHPDSMFATQDVFDPEKRAMPMVMVWTLLGSLIACTLLYAALVRSRYRLQVERDALYARSMEAR